MQMCSSLYQYFISSTIFVQRIDRNSKRKFWLLTRNISSLLHISFSISATCWTSMKMFNRSSPVKNISKKQKRLKNVSILVFFSISLINNATPIPRSSLLFIFCFIFIFINKKRSEGESFLFFSSSSSRSLVSGNDQSARPPSNPLDFSSSLPCRLSLSIVDVDVHSFVVP